MGFKEISPLEAMNALADGRPVYRFSQMSQELLAKTSVSGFLNLRFAVEGDYPPVDDTEEPEPVEKVTEKKTPSKKSADKMPPVKIDWYKAEALRNAGWPNKAIAEELGTTTASIASGFYQRKKKAEMKKLREQNLE